MNIFRSTIRVSRCMYKTMHSHQLSFSFKNLTAPKKNGLFARFRAKSIPDRNYKVPEDIALPRGVWWLRHTKVREEAVFGDSFVIHRSQKKPTDLVVLSPEDTMVQVWIPNMIGSDIVRSSPCELLPPEFADEGMTVDVEITTEEPQTHDLSTNVSAIVFMGKNPVSEEPIQQSSSPRRTRKVKFKCNRCKTLTEKFINPHAWNHGVVFCQCDGCKVVHLIRDQKGIFSCLKGPLFPQTIDPQKLKFPKGISANPGMVDRQKPQYKDPDDWLV